VLDAGRLLDTSAVTVGAAAALLPLGNPGDDDGGTKAT